nr:hypothetical protein [Candidatus Levybacteria bacterium]
MKKRNLKLKTKKILYKAIPLWLVFVLIFNSVIGFGFLEYLIMKRNFNQYVVALSKTTKNPDELVQILKQQVLPQKGYVLSVVWGDIGKQLLDSGAIDKQKYDQQFVNEPGGKDMMQYLDRFSVNHMAINEKNSHFMVNTLWALGLINKSKALDEGPMREEGVETGNMASTGGWTLGSKPAMELYSSKSLINLTPEQEELVKKIASNIYRPCCGNSTYFPDCNHGMAALGYIELAVKQGVPEQKIYKDILALNSFWFPQQYVNLAAYFNKQGVTWQKVDPKLVLGIDYSSGQGAAKIQQAIQDVPGLDVKGGGCGA